ncbi:MAG: N-acyl amino acid synthase FeeM domain-containing protein [Roseateles sp.]
MSRRYADRGYLCSDLSAHVEEGSVIVCSAFEGATAVGTISVRFDSAQGFKAEQVFGPEVHALRASGMSLCEFGRLAVDQQVVRNKSLLAHLFHLAYLHAHRLAGCEMAVVEVNPRHVAFYQRMLGYKVLAEERMNPRVKAPAVLMSIDLEFARQQIACFGGNADLALSTRSLYPYFYDATQEAAMLAKLRQ